MKQLTSGLLIGALASGLLTYTLVKPTDSASADSASAQPSLFQKEKSKSAGQQRSSSSAHSPQSGRSSTQNKAIGSVAHLQDLKTTRDQLQAANDIFSLSLDEVQALLRSPEIAGTNYFDQSGMTLISAAFARLTELSPEEAQKSLREFKSPLKQMGAMALYKEWAIQDPEAAMAAASEEGEPNVKNMALAAVLGELAINPRSI